MRIGTRQLGVMLALAFAIASCSKTEQQSAATQEPPAPAAPKAAAVSEARLLNADNEPGNWMSHGRTYSEQDFSPLTQINADNVKDLGLAWYFDLDTKRGQESTPLVIDGVMYVTTAWSKVKALDAATGKLIWGFDPQVPGDRWPSMSAAMSSIAASRRGTARSMSARWMARLIALDAKTGEKVWEVKTGENNRHYAITGAPRVVKGKVLIGNAGAEYRRARLYHRL